MRAREQELMLRLHHCKHQQLRSCHSSPWEPVKKEQGLWGSGTIYLMSQHDDNRLCPRFCLKKMRETTDQQQEPRSETRDAQHDDNKLLWGSHNMSQISMWTLHLQVYTRSYLQIICTLKITKVVFGIGMGWLDPTKNPIAIAEAFTVHREPYDDMLNYLSELLFTQRLASNFLLQKHCTSLNKRDCNSEDKRSILR